MDRNQQAEPSGPVEARYLSFLETISSLRPSLHRYCACMTGSVMDGEDVVQEALFEAYRKLDQFDDSRPLKPCPCSAARTPGLHVRLYGSTWKASRSAILETTRIARGWQN